MTECKKCGYKTSEEMSFCPKCGAPLKAATVSAEQRPAAPTRYRSEKAEKHEKKEKEEKTEKHEKSQYAFIGPLVGGIVLIIIGLMSYLQITGILTRETREILGALFLIVIGIVIIFGGLYATMMARRRYPRT
jgi:cation transport ATPase